MTERTCRTLLFGLFFALAAGPGDAAPPEERVVPSRVVAADPLSKRPGREVFDVKRVTLEAAEGRLLVEAEFRRPVVEGVFQTIHVFVDCDGEAKTGMNGADLWVRAAVGSPYQRTSAAPRTEGATAPIDLRRIAWSHVHHFEVRGTSGYDGWLHQRANDDLIPPTVEGAVVRFWIPLRMLVDRGLRYNRSVDVWLTAEGRATEHPIFLDYRCEDEGSPIRLDGDARDWSGQTRVEDDTGDLHPDASEVDVLRLLVDHDADSVHALVRLAGAGLPEERPDDDVEDDDQVSIGVEPLASGGQYGEYLEITKRIDVPNSCAEARKGLVEFSVEREANQGAFRVSAWSDAIRRDKVPDTGWFKVGVTPEALNPK